MTPMMKSDADDDVVDDAIDDVIADANDDVNDMEAYHSGIPEV